jgi:hypothetical protein
MGEARVSLLLKWSTVGRRSTAYRVGVPYGNSREFSFYGLSKKLS